MSVWGGSRQYMQCKRNGVTGKLERCDRNRAKQRESMDQQNSYPYDVSESACFSHAVDAGNASLYCSAPAWTRLALV